MPRLPNAALAAALLLLTALTPGPAGAGLLGGRGQPDPTPAIVEQALALAQDDRQEALNILEGYLAEGGDPELLPWVAVNAGEQRRLAGDLEAAAAHFERVLREHPEHAARDAATLGLALVAMDGGRGSGNTLATLKVVPSGLVPETQNADRYRLLALQAEREGADPAELRQYVDQALSFAEADRSAKARVHRSLAHLLTDQQLTQAAALGDESLSGEALALQRARAALNARDLAGAQAQAQALLDTYPQTELRLEAEWVLKRAKAGDPYKPRSIGVLLPLSGSLAPPGQQILEALQLAVAESGGAATLVVRDTGGDPAKALAEFERLVLQDGVAAVVGPLLKEEVFPVAEQAQAAGVPLIALTQAPKATEAGDYVFRTFVTYEQQVDALLDHTMGTLGMTRFAIMAPDNAYGQATRDEFTRQVMERGGAITRQVMYPADATDFRKSAAQLGLKDYETRKSELARLKREAEARGMDPDRVVLPPTVDFDAIFIPDNYNRVALVASALAYEEFPVGNFRPHRGATPVPLLGLNGWHNADLATRGGQYVASSYFTDAFVPGASEGAMADFTDAFADAHSRKPGVMEAIGYDTGRLVVVAARTDPASRADWRAALAGAALTGGVSGATGFGADRELSRKVTVFVIRGGQMVPVEEVPVEVPAAP